MARVELIHGMTDEQLNSNYEYAIRMHQSDPDREEWRLWMELLNMERVFRVKLIEYKQVARREYSGPRAGEMPPGNLSLETAE